MLHPALEHETYPISEKLEHDPAETRLERPDAKLALSDATCCATELGGPQA